MSARPTASRSRSKAPQQSGKVSLRGRAIRYGTDEIPLYSGAVHYWRLAPTDWRPALESLKDASIPIVETYVPWDVHEVTESEYDFGSRNPQNDVGAFIDLAADLGLLVFARPGPHINSEMTRFGLPARVIYDKACQARSPRQNPVILGFPPQMFPVPSYASANYHAEVGRWYDAVGEQLAPRLYPDGPIVLLQVDNEAAFYFRNGPYDQDYHPDATRIWREFLESKYASIDATASAHRMRYRSFEDAKPPERFDARGPEDLVLHLDWAEFQEHLVTDALQRMKRRMSRAGLKGVPILHNIPLGDGGLPMNVPAISEVVDLVGFDYYHAAREYRTIKRRTLYLAGTLRFPYAPEMGIGAPPWFTPLAHEDSLFCAMCALAYGLRGYNLYMWVDRDRWYGAPIDARGRARPEAATWAKLQDALMTVQFHMMTRTPEVALLVPREYARLSRATHLFGGVSPSAIEALGGTPVDGSREDTLGFGGAIQILWWRMLAKVSDALTAAGIPYVYIDSAADPDRFQSYKTVISPTYEFIDPKRWTRLQALAADGTTIVYGPAIPTLTEAMHPFAAAPIANGRRVLLDTPNDARLLVESLQRELDLARPFPVRPAPLETALHESHDARVLFVLHPGETFTEAEIELPSPMVFRDLLSDETFDGETSLRVPMRPQTCRMFQIQPNGSTVAKAPPSVRPRARRALGPLARKP